MKTIKFYTYLGKCIQKARYNKMNQAELSHGICGKATLSRIENGKIPSRKKVIDQLIAKLGYEYDIPVDMYVLQADIKYLIEMIEYNRNDEIVKTIHKMHTIIKRNTHNLFFLDYQTLYRYLYTHYIKVEEIEVLPYDFNTIPYVDESFYILFFHVYLENLLCYRGLMTFYYTFKHLNLHRSHSLLDFFYILALQIEGQTLEVLDIYDAYKDKLQKDKKTYQVFRYLSIVTAGHIEYEPQKALHNFNIIKDVYDTTIKESNYFYIVAFGLACISIKQKEYKEAYEHLENCIQVYPLMLSFALPYMVFLSYRCGININPAYLKEYKCPLNNACVSYHLYRDNTKPGFKHIRYLMRHILPLLKNFRLSDPFVVLLRAEEQAQYSRRSCNVTAIDFYEKLKESCKEVSQL